MSLAPIDRELRGMVQPFEFVEDLLCFLRRRGTVFIPLEDQHRCMESIHLKIRRISDISKQIFPGWHAHSIGVLGPIEISAWPAHQSMGPDKIRGAWSNCNGRPE